MNLAARQQVQTPTASEDLNEILAGLGKVQKSISPKYFYDDVGSKLFDDICELPEYYPTRTELAIMRENIDEIVSLVGPEASLIEFGSGSSLKTRILLDNLRDLAAYVPVDISHEHLQEAANALQQDYPHIEILPITADFMHSFDLPNPKIAPQRNLVYFPGSTIGNFTRSAAGDLLSVMHHEAGEDGALLIGVDLQKDPAILERAYNDSAGVTAAFNLNVLQRLNNEFDATFDLANFRHRAEYNAEAGRIEIYLDSLEEQNVEVGGTTFHFAAGESILTEHSHKYTLQSFAEMANHAGFEVAQVWLDDEHLFSVQYCVRD